MAALAQPLTAQAIVINTAMKAGNSINEVRADSNGDMVANGMF